MPQIPNDREATIKTDNGGVIARWAEWQGRSKRCRVEAIGRANAKPTMFVADELLADPNDREMLEELRRLGAEVIPDAPLIRPPDGIQLRELRVARITRPSRYFLLVETGDEVLDYREAVAFYAGANQFVRGGGDHTFTDFDAQLAAIVRFAGVPVG